MVNHLTCQNLRKNEKEKTNLIKGKIHFTDSWRGWLWLRCPLSCSSSIWRWSISPSLIPSILILWSSALLRLISRVCAWNNLPIDILVSYNKMKNKTCMKGSIITSRTWVHMLSNMSLTDIVKHLHNLCF